MTEQPLEPSPTQPTPKRDAAEERAIFITSMTAGFLGALLLGCAALFYWTIWEQEPGSQTPSILEYRKWFLAAGTGLTTLGILLNGQSLWDWLVRKRSLVALNVFLMTALAIALVALVDYVTYRHFTEFDWTKSKVYSISDESIQVATNLDRDVKIAIILDEGGDTDVVRKLIDHYAAHTTRISVKTLDPYVDRDEAMQLLHEFGIDRPDSKREVDGVYIRSGYMEKAKDEKGETTSVWHTQKKKRLSRDDLFEESMGGPRGGGGPRKFKGEQAMTSALMEISEDKKSKVYFLTGHGELDMDGQSPNGEHEAGKFSRSLRGKNYEVASLNILQREQKDVPADADAVVTDGADGPFDKQEVDALEAYLSKGGKLLVLLPPSFTQGADGDLQFKSTGLEPLLRKYNVEVKDDLIVGVELKLEINQNGELERVPEITTKVVADQFDSSCKLSAPLAGKRALFYDSRPVRALADNPHMAATEFLKTPPKAYFTTKTARIKEPPKEKVSIPLGVAVEPKGDLKDKATRLVVLGSSAPSSNVFWSEGANEPLILNGIVYLLGQTRFTKEPVHEGDYHLDVSPDVAFLYRLVACPGMPFLAILLAITVSIVRRR